MFRAILLIFLGVGVLGEDAETVEPQSSEGSEVVVLTDDNFDTEVTPDAVWLVEFYAPWCGHCKSLAPEYEAAATKIKEAHGDAVKLGKVDATVEETTAGKFDISGYPTLLIFKEGGTGKSFPYEAGRTAADIAEFMAAVEDGSWAPPVDRVVALTADTFDAFVEAESITLVEFYAPWCGHCKQLAPKYEKAAGILHDKGIKIAKVDATEETELGTRFDVSGYPTLKLFRKGVAEDFDAGRETNDIVDELIEQSTDPAKMLETIFDTEVLTEGDEHVVIGWFTSVEDPEYVLYQAAAANLRKSFTFKYTLNPAVLANYGGAKPGTVTVFHPKFYVSKHDKPTATFALGGATAEQFQAFVKENAHTLIGKYAPSSSGAEGYDDLFPKVLLFADLPTDRDLRAESKVVLERAAGIAAAFPGVAFAHIPETNDRGEPERAMDEYGIADQDQEVKAVFMKSADERYVMDDDGDLAEFVAAAAAGELPPYVKSQPAPKKHDGHVTVVVGSTFDKVVMDDAADVLIEFYAPWCGHCKQLAPKYKKLAKRLKDVTGLVIAKIDATANDYPKTTFPVQGFPTTFLAKAGDKQNPVNCEAREVKDFLKFLRENSSAEIPKPKKKKKKKKANQEGEGTAADEQSEEPGTEDAPAHASEL